MYVASLIFQIFILGLAIYFYNFAQGKYMYMVKNEQKKTEMEAFIKKNGSWLKPTSLVLAILMGINVLLSVINR